MKVAIMQPYFFPYVGYFQLIASVDLFILYDNIKYTKKGWINRNRMLQNGEDVMFSLPLKKGSDYLDVCERELAANFATDPTSFTDASLVERVISGWARGEMEITSTWARAIQAEPKLWLRAQRGQGGALVESLETSAGAVLEMVG